MHAPDGFLTAGTAAATAVISAGSVGAALRRSREELAESQVPLAGVAAAFVFAVQMLNFPVAAGTSGHLLGGALAAVLLGPSVGMVVVTVVVIVQALIFADGGLTALGYNVLNMAVVTSLGGWAVFVGARRLLPATRRGIVVATGVAAGASVVLSATAFSIEWLFGASVPIAFDRVFLSMVGVHLLIGIGEGAISAMVIGSVLRVRPDLVRGAAHLELGTPTAGRRGRTGPVAVGLGLALLAAAGLSQFAAEAPDGLERVAIDQGFVEAGEDHALASGPFADYATRGVADPATSLAMAGTAGVVLTLALGSGALLAVRSGRSRVDTR